MKIKQSENHLDDVLARCSPHVLELVESLRKMVAGVAPGAAEHGYKGWNNICYDEGDGTFCALAPVDKQGRVNLYFQQGAHLPDPQGLLEGTGKSMRHVKVRTTEQVRSQTEPLRQLLRAAVLRARGSA